MLVNVSMYMYAYVPPEVKTDQSIPAVPSIVFDLKDASNKV